MEKVVGIEISCSDLLYVAHELYLIRTVLTTIGVSNHISLEPPMVTPAETVLNLS